MFLSGFSMVRLPEVPFRLLPILLIMCRLISGVDICLFLLKYTFTGLQAAAAATSGARAPVWLLSSGPLSMVDPLGRSSLLLSIFSPPPNFVVPTLDDQRTFLVRRSRCSFMMPLVKPAYHQKGPYRSPWWASSFLTLSLPGLVSELSEKLGRKCRLRRRTPMSRDRRASLQPSLSTSTLLVTERVTAISHFSPD